MSILKDARNKKGVTLRQMQADINTLNSWISMLENGKLKDPSIQTVSVVCDYLDVDIAEVIKELLKSKKQKQ